MKQPKITIELKKDGTIDAKMHGDIKLLVSAIVDVMEQSNAIKAVILAAGEMYNNYIED
ncbi:hypothetical protein [Pseudotamlana carrageenivorans]|uniref:hypothetical protein n=1 Tax=Pseudotamlana carrageenivorans TaxID=2069432 RepID=UPI00131519DE|nr:hypothetical protein [Tamlana carrageenivorans]